MLVVTWFCFACTSGGSDDTHKEGHLHCSDTNCEERNRVCIPATETSYATCGDCVEDAYEHASACYPLTLCRSTEYESFPPSRNRDRECTPYSVECQPGEFEQSPRTETSDRVCAPISDCPEGLFEVEAPTATSNRVCSPLTVCELGEHQTTAPGPKNDRVCTACTAKYYCAGGEAPREYCGVRDHDKDPTTPCAEIIDIRTGYVQTCVVAETGDFWCWDRSNSTAKDHPNGLKKVRSIDPELYYTCAVDHLGKARCWGGSRTAPAPSVPANLPELTMVRTSRSHACAIDVAGKAHCWGSTAPNPPSSLSPLFSLAVTSGGACGLDVEGALHCWGTNPHNGGTPPDASQRYEMLESGYRHTCAVNEAGDVTCWGDPGDGRIDVPGDLPPIIAIAAGSSHNCAIDHQFKAHCWGNNATRRATPPADLPGLLLITAHRAATWAWGVDGKVYHWGEAPAYGVPGYEAPKDFRK